MKIHTMKDQLTKLKKEFDTQLAKVASINELEKLEQDYFARKSGKMTDVMRAMKDLDEQDRKEIGKLSNELKKYIQTALEDKRKELESKKWETLAVDDGIDVTQPKLGTAVQGHIHPISVVEHDAIDLFRSMGFQILNGPELESDYYNFTAVNIPENHPARDMSDTFYIKDHLEWVMRTHTSNMQVRGPEEIELPLRFVVPGRCFRNEATDPRHEHTFYQLEGMMIDKGISFSHMKGVLEALAKHLYGEETEVRLRPKFYPFVEPGVNGEVTCFLCKGNGCRVCKKTGWLEVFGSGPTHPNVLREAGIDPEEYQAFAFGFGLNRLVMLKYGIEDIRHFMTGDMRFLEQF